jgi:Domain of unknown function (DUF1707)
VPSGFPPGDEPAGHEAWRGLRASDADRDQVVDLLRAAAGDGRLAADEFEERLEATLSARTYGDLAALTADLVPAPGPPGIPEAAARPARRDRLDDVVRIDQRGGSVRRGGRWVVPQRLELRSSWCDVMFDFADAVIPHSTMRIDMNVRGGSLVLVTKPGIVVDVGSLAARYTDVKIGQGAEPGIPVILRVRLTGRIRYGWIEQRLAAWPVG